MKKQSQKTENLAKKISKEVLSQLDDEQLKQIAGGATDENPDDEEEGSCISVANCISCIVVPK